MQRVVRQAGFTLVEIAVVVLIVTILLGYTMAMFPVQQELKQYRQVGQDMDRIVEHLIGFAQVNGRLPCPDTNGNINGTGAGVPDGAEDTDDLDVSGDPDSCKAFSGWLPARTLGLTGNIGANGTLLDPWGQPYWYHVAPVDFSDGEFDLVTPNGIRNEGLSNVAPNLSVCSDSNNPSAADTDCTGLAGPPLILTDNAVAVIYSSGKDQAGVASNIQDENADGFHNGTADLVYTSTTRSDVPSFEFDDKVRWISPNLLFSKMIEAERLP